SGGLKGTAVCVYRDERIDPRTPTFTFRVTSDIAFMIRPYSVANGGTHDNNGALTLGWEEMVTYQKTTLLGNGWDGSSIEYPVLHSEEYFIIDTGEQTGLYLGHANSGTFTDYLLGLQVIWFFLVDFSFDGVYHSLVGTGTEHGSSTFR